MIGYNKSLLDKWVSNQADTIWYPGNCPGSWVVKSRPTDGLLSLTTAQVPILAVACEKVAGDLGLGCGFLHTLQIPPPPTTAISKQGRFFPYQMKIGIPSNSQIFRRRSQEVLAIFGETKQIWLFPLPCSYSVLQAGKGLDHKRKVPVAYTTRV